MRRLSSHSPPPPNQNANLSIPSKTNPGADLSESLRASAMSKDNEIRKEHEKLPESFETRKRRLIWRSKQRGLLECDILLGTWAVENVPSMQDVKEVDQYEHLLNLETIDLFNVVSKQNLDYNSLPPQVRDGPILDRVRKFALSYRKESGMKF